MLSCFNVLSVVLGFKVAASLDGVCVLEVLSVTFNTWSDSAEMKRERLLL